MATNVKPEDLNYDHYETAKYDKDIVRSIPGHVELHKAIDQIVRKNLKGNPQILELGVGTGLTTLRILKNLPKARFTVVDFSKTMLDGARRKLHKYKVNYLCGDYAKLKLSQHNDVVLSVIGLHHQETDNDKKKLFKKIYSSLKKGGIFIFGDLVTFKNLAVASLNDAYHFHYLVEHAEDEKSLKEWAYHHKHLNKLAPLENQVAWLKGVGFKKVEVVFKKFNTALIVAEK
ncbi:class I SAM-dependent methyltransferase [Candidatus Woesearchaeota archaeon]|nr:class I SAM-dependent methyltransferase [Candidatus Woesearchaeota archaeon]